MHKKLEICFSPELLQFFDMQDKVVIIVDILRATSCITAGIYAGLEHIVPLLTVQECLSYKKRGYTLAGERNGSEVVAFDMNNAPTEFIEAGKRGRKVAMTTTNGTKAIGYAKDASTIIIGSFLNLSLIAQHIRHTGQSLIILCSGWRGMFSMEDAIFAGALAQKLMLTATYTMNDEAKAAITLFQAVENDLYAALKTTTYAQRLASKQGITRDIIFCAKIDSCPTVPILVDNRIQKYCEQK